MTWPDALRSRAEELRAARTPFALATVTRVVRPTSAKPGDRALVLSDGLIEGFVGGTCAEAALRVHGLAVLRGGDPLTLRIVPGEPPAEHEHARGEGVVTVPNPCGSGGLLEIFLEAVLPPPLIQVHGDAPVARALREIGAVLGYQVTEIGKSGAGPSAAPVSADSAAVVVASHGRDEEPVLAAALAAAVPYVGLVASRRRGAQVLTALDASDGDKARVRTPAGLDIGARTPAEIALSIYAQMLADGALRPGTGAAPGSRQESAGAADSSAADSGPDGAEPGTAIDPVCAMTVAMVPATLRLPHDGRVFYFCGPGCRQAFADDPARYTG